MFLLLKLSWYRVVSRIVIYEMFVTPVELWKCKFIDSIWSKHPVFAWTMKNKTEHAQWPGLWSVNGHFLQSRRVNSNLHPCWHLSEICCCHYGSSLRVTQVSKIKSENVARFSKLRDGTKIALGELSNGYMFTDYLLKCYYFFST